MRTKSLLFIALLAISFSVSAQAWRQQNTQMTGASTVGVDQVSVVDSNIAWVNGFNGSGVGADIKAHSRTNNGGELWVAGNYNGFAPKVFPRVLAASSYTTAFCVAMDTTPNTGLASFWKTVDGGANWSLVTGIMNNGSTTFADGVGFWSSLKGFCYGDPVSNKFDIYYTIDGGSTWTPTLAADVAAPKTGEYGFNGSDCMAKADNGVAAFITNKGRVYKTTNYGVNWDTTAVAPFATSAGGKIFMSSSNFMIYGNLATSTSTSFVWKYTTDGGATWLSYTAASGPFYNYSMTSVPGTNMLVAAAPYAGNKGIAYTTDGSNWVDFYDNLFLQFDTANNQMLGVGFADQNNGWVGNYNAFQTDVNSILRYQKLNTNLFSLIATPIYDTCGTVTGSGNYTDGTSVTITANPFTGYLFEKWVAYPGGADVSTLQSYTFNMPVSNTVYLASFIADPNVSIATNEVGKIAISPNPATNNVVITLNTKQLGLYNLNILDLTGKSVYSNSIQANTTLNLDVNSFAKGVYFVKISNNKNQFVQKLIIK